MDIKEEWENAQEGKVIFDIDNKFVSITSDNAIRAMALIISNPKYAKSYAANTHSSSSELLNKLKNWDEETIISILDSVNAENSTHVSQDDRKTICNNLLNIGKEDFEKMLKNTNYSIIADINEKCEIMHLSFASKFCHFYCWHIIGYEKAEEYPIIDSIMRKIIPIFDCNYNYANKDYNQYKKVSLLYKYRETSYGSIPKRINEKDYGVIGYYKDYVNALQGISNKKGVSVTGIEQLLWWYYKDIIDDVDVVNNKMKNIE